MSTKPEVRQQSSGVHHNSDSDPLARHAGIAQINAHARPEMETTRSFHANYVQGKQRMAETGEDANGTTFDQTYVVPALSQPNYIDDDARLIGRAALQESVAKTDNLDAKSSGMNTYQRREKTRVPASMVKSRDTQSIKHVPKVRTEI